MPQPVDITKSLPDEAHEGIRLGVVQAISDLGDSLLLVGTLFDLHDGARTDIGTSQADLGDSLLLVGVLFELIDQLTARVAALESPPAPPT